MIIKKTVWSYSTNTLCKVSVDCKFKKNPNKLYDWDSRLTTTTNNKSTFLKQFSVNQLPDFLHVWSGCTHTSLYEVTEVAACLETLLNLSVILCFQSYYSEIYSDLDKGHCFYPDINIKLNVALRYSLLYYFESTPELMPFIPSMHEHQSAVSFFYLLVVLLAGFMSYYNLLNMCICLCTILISTHIFWLNTPLSFSMSVFCKYHICLQQEAINMQSELTVPTEINSSLFQLSS